MEFPGYQSATPALASIKDELIGYKFFFYGSRVHHSNQAACIDETMDFPVAVQSAGYQRVIHVSTAIKDKLIGCEFVSFIRESLIPQGQSVDIYKRLDFPVAFKSPGYQNVTLVLPAIEDNKRDLKGRKG